MHYKKNDLKFQIPYYLLSVRNKKLLWMYRSNSPLTEQSEQRLLAQNDSKMKKHGRKLPEYQKYTIIFHNLLVCICTYLDWVIGDWSSVFKNKCWKKIPNLTHVQFFCRLRYQFPNLDWIALRNKEIIFWCKVNHHQLKYEKIVILQKFKRMHYAL